IPHCSGGGTHDRWRRCELSRTRAANDPYNRYNRRLFPSSAHSALRLPAEEAVVRTTLRQAVIVAATLLPCAAVASDWPGFRGPKGLGVSEDKGLVAHWGPDMHVLWKVKLAGPGSSSPVVRGQRVFITCYTDYSSAKG